LLDRYSSNLFLTINVKESGVKESGVKESGVKESGINNGKVSKEREK
jgi:hypothetical protein